MNLPTRRTADILEQATDKELLIYDLHTNKAYNLNETLRIVYSFCDGQTTFDDLKRRYKYTDDLIYLALDELQKNDLIENYTSNHFAGMNRREVIRRVGLSSMIALPVISSLVAPTAAMAQSGAALRTVCQTCTANADCAVGRCLPNAQGGSNLCAINTQPNTYALGTGFGASDSQCTNLVGPSFCCSGQASKATGTCQCE